MRQFLHAGVIDELRLHLVPILLGGGVRLFTEPADRALTLSPVDGAVDESGVTHLRGIVRLDAR